MRGYFDFVQLIVVRGRQEKRGNLCIWMGMDLDIMEIFTIIAPLKYKINTSKFYEKTVFYLIPIVLQYNTNDRNG